MPPMTHNKTALEAAVLADETLSYHFGMNGGAGPVSEKGWRIINAILSIIAQLEARPAVVDARPVAWVRRHPDGALSAEFLEDAVIEPVRMNSGAWLPLGIITDALPSPAVEADESQHSLMLGQAVMHFNRKWPIKCSGVELHFTGQSFTQKEFEDRVALSRTATPAAEGVKP